MISNAPEFLANVGEALYEADPIYFDVKRAWRDMPWNEAMVRQIERIMNQPSGVWKVDRPGPCRTS